MYIYKFIYQECKEVLKCAIVKVTAFHVHSISYSNILIQFSNHCSTRESGVEVFLEKLDIEFFLTL